ncbi:tRNA (adenosine(37)-N6)-threonylcarbamoyltransferase complex ATPase subunit type 1 TsaE [Nodosilinea sp. P-1105]|uniref:tRNA (adenosine(37)-N6)-threonylcarbamoyltransferase complex ATPase subunit type 1 TsaE n=1 Tax=Nodosilinea sp. P-1105 TaxID=2546229 RepID=UPI00146F497C|nr:tRNA (adenosine(37)-N6)-threonylcarbamoyltransferase complex ATPase subunit type 1 TsaE [Nodosilinea sp. P-1105]NMF83094.1 tRNA (adenosine(37)-N6)-threonylcarbamoyltransferase complex ATPase subunit type 1 TsaE [Nodosilinea sp. P-1105]
MVPCTFRLDLPHPQATKNLGQSLGQHCPAGMILLLSGDLGAGKTTLVQGIGAGLGLVEPIASPTFTLVNEYLEGRIPLYHVDLYRLSPAEAVSLYLDSYWDPLETTPGLVAIEWGDRLWPPPPDALEITLTDTAAGGRQATLVAITPDHVTLLENLPDHGLLVNEV